MKCYQCTSNLDVFLRIFFTERSVLGTAVGLTTPGENTDETQVQGWHT